jgi:hypothetical protein
MIEKKYDLKLKDFLKYNFLFRMVSQLIIYVLLIAFLAVFIEMSVNKVVDWGTVGPYLYILLYFVIGIIIVVGYLYLVTYLGTKRAYASNASVFKDVHIIFEEKGISQVVEKIVEIDAITQEEKVTRESRVDTIDYSELSKISFRFGLIVILITKQQGLIAPMNLFTAEELAQIKQWYTNTHFSINKYPESEEDLKDK